MRLRGTGFAGVVLVLGLGGMSAAVPGGCSGALAWVPPEPSMPSNLLAQASVAQVQALLDAGSEALAQEQWAEAQRYLTEGLAIATALDNPLLQMRALSLLIGVEGVLGDYPSLLPHAQRLLQLAQSQGSETYLTLAHQALGSAYFYTGDFTQALAQHQQVLAQAERVQDPYFLAVAQANVGETYLALSQPEVALTHLQSGLALAQRVEAPDLVGVIQGTLGKVYSVLGQYDQALPYLRQSLVSEQAVGTPLGTAQALNNLGTTLFLAGDLPQAEASLRQAIALWETQRVQVSDSTQAVQFFDTQLLTYRTLQQVLIAQGNPAAALVVAEQGRAQTFAAQLGSRSGQSAPAPDLAGFKQVAQDLQATLVVYSLVPHSQDLFIPGRVNNRWQNTLQSLFIWVIQPTGEIRFQAVNLQNEPIDLLAYVAATRQAMGVGGRASVEVERTVDENAQRERLQRLHSILIDPIAQYLPADPAATVVLLPQESLFLVPFAALQDRTDTYLIQRHTLALAPSIQVLGLVAGLRASRLAGGRPADLRGQAALVVGNPTMPAVSGLTLPPLPGAEQEALAIAPQLHTTPLLGANATEATVKAQLPTAGIIHLATHGLLDYGTGANGTGANPIPGALALAPTVGTDGLLTAAEILDLHLSADLAVLSACDTGLGTITGDGVIGLSRSLITAGVPSVVVSLWSVPDAPTAELMETFYAHLLAGEPKAQALRQAMLTVLATHPDPRSWAAFTLIGEPN